MQYRAAVGSFNNILCHNHFFFRQGVSYRNLHTFIHALFDLSLRICKPNVHQIIIVIFMLLFICGDIEVNQVRVSN